MSLRVSSQTVCKDTSKVCVSKGALRNALHIKEDNAECWETVCLKDSIIETKDNIIVTYTDSIIPEYKERDKKFGKIEQLVRDSCDVVVESKDAEIEKQKKHKWGAVGVGGVLIIIIIAIL